MATKRYKRNLNELELRRRKGMRMLARGVALADVARALDVSRQTTSSWARKLAEDAQAWRRKPLGRPSGLGAAQKKALGKALLAGAVANGFPTELWTLARMAKLIARDFGVTFSTIHLAHSARDGLLQPTPGGSCAPARRDGDQAMARQALAGTKKSPAAKGAPSSSSTKAG
jgi:transposase